MSESSLQQDKYEYCFKIVAELGPMIPFSASNLLFQSKTDVPLWHIGEGILEVALKAANKRSDLCQEMAKMITYYDYEKRIILEHDKTFSEQRLKTDSIIYLSFTKDLSELHNIKIVTREKNAFDDMAEDIRNGK